MKKLILSLVILFSCHSAHAATVQGDADSNGALDVAKGGTNSTTAADARTALGVPATASTLVGDCTVGPCLDGSTDGGNLIKLWAGTGSYWTALQGGAPAANRSWRLPIDAPPSAGETNVMTMDEYGQMAFLDKPSTSGYVLSSTDAGVLSWIANGSGESMVYPGAGLAVSTGSAWTTSLTCSNDADVIEWDSTTSKFVCVTPVTYTAGTSISLAGNQISVTGLAIGTNVQAYDADLTTWAGVTPGTGVATALAVNVGSAGAVALYNGALGTPSSLNLTNAVVNSGTSLPGTCTAGQLFLDTDADTNGQLYSCISANTWKDVDDDGGSGGMATTDIDTSSEIAAIVTDETGSGALVFATSPVFSTSVGIPQGASPTVDAAGEIAIDTTSDQLKYYGGAERVLTYKKQIDFVVKTPVDADDFLLLKAQTAITITDIHVIAQGGTSISVDIQECDSAGANCATVDAAITADTDGAEDDGSLSNGTIDAGDWVKVVLGAPSGTVNFLTGSIYYVETAN